MSLANIKTKSQGFTIVELLIVVVVIAILAAITIVSYSGITARANESAVKLQASNFAKKAEAYNAEVGNYPLTVANLNGDSTKSYYFDTTYVNISTSTTTNTTNLSSTDTNGTKRLAVNPCGGNTTATVTGLKINFYNPNKSGGAGNDFITVGSGTGCS